MNICEIFYSIQGESTYAGLPCIFIRLAECNLRCNYCDTKYSYEPGTEMSVAQVLDEISRYDCSLVEITGGEPLLQFDFAELMEALDIAGYTVLLETNGTVSIKPVPNAVRIIIDFKLPGSGHPDSFHLPNLQWLKEKHDEFKFVVTDRQDFETALAFIREHKLEHHILLFSPVSDKLSPATLADWILESGLPLRLNLQLHKYLNIK